MSYKKKISVLIALLAIITVALFAYGFGLTDSANNTLAANILESRKQLEELKSEQRNFQLGKQDLESLLSKPFKPENFFSTDVSLVNEIRTLESVAQAVDINLSLSVSGTVGNAPRAQTVTELKTIPFTMQITGSFDNAIKFLDTVEHLAFITNIQALNVTPATKGQVAMVMTGNFFVKK